MMIDSLILFDTKSCNFDKFRLFYKGNDNMLGHAATLYYQLQNYIITDSKFKEVFYTLNDINSYKHFSNNKIYMCCDYVNHDFIKDNINYTFYYENLLKYKNDFNNYNIISVVLDNNGDCLLFQDILDTYICIDYLQDINIYERKSKIKSLLKIDKK